MGGELMKILFIIIVMMSTLTVSGVNKPECIFTLINPSATNTALGRIGGGANIWTQNPLDIWDNPAKLGYFRGISLGYTHDSWYEEAYEGRYYDAAYSTVGWSGLGAMYPLTTSKSALGSRLDTGKWLLYDENGNEIDPIYQSDISTGFAIGMNLMESYCIFFSNRTLSKIQSFSELSIGYNYNFIRFGTWELGNKNRDRKLDRYFYNHSNGLGLIFRLSPLNEINNASHHFIKADIVSSVYFRNLSHSSIVYIRDSVPIHYGTDIAVAIKMRMDIDNMQRIISSEIYDFLSVFCSDIISCYCNYGSYITEDFEDEIGTGIELTLLDIVSFRWGYHSDKSGNIEGNTSGIGINLSYKGILNFQYNFAKFPGGDLQKYQTKDDFMLNFNLVALFEQGII